jgi:O-antigen/teichoic acid export membrane protein
MIVQDCQRLLSLGNSTAERTGKDLRSDLGWHSLKSNAGAVLGARLLVPALSVVLIVVIARLAGAAFLGRYTLLITLFVLCENLKSLGLTTQMVREVAKDDVGALAHYRSLVRIGLWGALVTAPLIYVVASNTSSAWQSLLFPAFVISLGLVPSAYALANDALFLALGRARLSMYVALGENLLRLGVSIVAVVFWGSGVTGLCAIYAITRGFAALAQELVIRRHLHLVLPPYDSKVTKSMLRSAPAFATVFVVPLILFRMDIVLLGLIASDYEVGVYSAALRLVTVCLIIPDGVMTATFALLSKFVSEKSDEEFRHLVKRTVQFVSALLICFSVGGALLAPLVLRTLFGAKFDAAIPVMQTLIWALVPFGVNRALGDALVARGEQGTVARIVLLNLVVGILLYLSLIPLLGLPGAAWAFYLSAMGCCICSAVVAVYRSKVVEGFMVWMAVAASIVGIIGVTAVSMTEVRVVLSVIACLLVGVGFVRTWLTAPVLNLQAKRRAL